MVKKIVVVEMMLLDKLIRIQHKLSSINFIVHINKKTNKNEINKSK